MWYFVEQFEKWAEADKHKKKFSKGGSKYFPEDGDPSHWLRDPKYKV